MSYDLADFKRQIEQARIECLARIDRVPIAALIWGPNPSSSDPIANTRVSLRDELRRKGHLAEFSEDLYDSMNPRSLFAQQVAQAEAYDIVFSIPGSFGSIAEIHDFARIPGISHKVCAFVDRTYTDGYSHQSLVATQTNASCKIQIYNSCELPNCVVDYALDQVSRLQELLYVAGRR
jgi:hypothetical protein